jgi:uncharacterized protein YdhG (YjbR/CyaY superfamily)
MPKTKHDPDAVDGYLAGLPDDRRRAFEELRQLIKATIPGAQERISYGTSVIFALKRDLVGFVAHEKHLSFFIMSPELARSMQDEIRETHRVSGATIHFSPERPLPASLVQRILQARLKEEAERAGPKRGVGL